MVAHLKTLALRPATGVDPAGEAARWTELEELHYSSYLAGDLDYLGQRRARARDFMRPYGIAFGEDAAAESWFEDYLHQYRAAWTLHSDALPALDRLRDAGVRLGIITNGVTHFQQPKLDVLGLTSYFEHVVTSGDFGAVKPDPSIFRHAAALFGVDASEAVYVGDRLHTDAIGAINAGLGGVWVDRGGRASEAELREASAAGAAVVTTLASLEAVLDLP